MKKIEIIKSIIVILAMTLFILTKTSVLAGSKIANGITAFLIVSVLMYYLVQAFVNIKTGLKNNY